MVLHPYAPVATRLKPYPRPATGVLAHVCTRRDRVSYPRVVAQESG